jgi:hypothetical protein
MALFPERIIFKNSATGLLNSIAEAAPGEINSLVPGELLLFREADGFRLYSLSISGSVVQVGARIRNENKGSLTVTNFGEGSSSFILNDGSVTTAIISNASITGAKLASPLSVEKGGTGQSTQTTAINALLPSQTGNADKVLGTDGASLFWDSKKSILNDYDNVDTVSEAPVSADCLRWNSATSNWVPDQDIQASVVPASATDTGRPGQLAFDSNYLYSCVGVNQWKRAPLSSWNYAQVLPLLLNSSAVSYSPESVGTLIPQYIGSGTYIGSRTPSNPWPAGHRPGDIGLLILSTDGGFTNNNTNIIAQGWTLIVSSVNGTTGIALYYKYAATSNEPNFVWNTGNSDTGAQIIVFRNITAVNPVDVTNNAYLGNNPSTQVQPLSVTTTFYNDLVLFFQRMGGTCATTGGCQVASSTTLYSPFYFDEELGNGQPTGDSAGMVQAHSSRRFEPGLASSILTYASPNYSYSTNIYRITAALKRRAINNPNVEIGVKDASVTPLIPRAGYVDPFWSSVALLMSMDGTNGSTTFTDKSINNHVFLAYNGAQISTAQSRFGGSSVFIDGVDDLLAIPNNISGSTAPTLISDWWTSSYTFECWVRPTAFLSTTSTLLYARPVGGNFYWSFGPVTNGALKMQWTNSGQTFMGQTLQSANSVISLNTWQHVAMTYDAATATLRLFANGTLVATRVGLSGTPVTAGPVWIGFGSNGFSGHADEIRITRDVARYTSSFTPPTKEFPSR